MVTDRALGDLDSGSVINNHNNIARLLAHTSLFYTHFISTMASTSSRHMTTTENTGSQPAPRTTGWGRLGEPGTAFSGLRGRGRGRSHARVARGGRGGRGKSADTISDGPTPTKAEAAIPPSATSTSTPSPADTSRSNSAPVVSPAASKAKATSKRPPCSLPTLVVDPSSPTSNIPPPNTATTPRTPNRRNRSQQQKSPNPASDKLAIPGSKPLRTRKSRSNIPPSLVLPKDAPPHMGAAASAGPGTSTFDIRNDIDALVERVRAVAMAENRPTTPGSHIDWAGDEDDSLPDLDDWGVTTGTNTGTGTMSPISVGLSSLPEPTEQPSITSEATLPLTTCSDVPTINVVEVVAVTDPEDADFSDAPAEAPGHSNGSVTNSFSTQITQQIVVYPDIASQPNLESQPCRPLESPTTVAEYPRKPLHPSLPPKPVAAMESLLAQSRLRPGAIAVRLPNAVKSLNAAEGPTADTVNLGIPAPKPSPEDETQAASVPNPTHTNQELTAEQMPFQGLSASIHAPNINPQLSSVACSSSVGLPTASRGFHPTHHRSHTGGRPQTAPMTSFPTSHSGYSTPYGRFSPSRNHHIRTHSSPADSTNQRTLHTTRPVITGDALSKLARTICNSGVSPTRTLAVAPSKE